MGLIKKQKMKVDYDNKSKKEYFEVWFIEHHDHHVIDDNFTKIWNEIGEK